MFDHVTLRVPDLAAASSALRAVLDQLEIEQTTSTPSFSVWGNFALTQTDEQHPIARRVHIAFIAPTTAHVDRFGETGINAGFADDGPAGPRPKYAEDYYSASLKDSAGNGFAKRSTATVSAPAAPSITSSYAPATSRRQRRSTPRSVWRRASRSVARPLTAQRSPSADQTAPCS
jgi:catechol 2,3-dioxygenase-like lactoylglutathione lyase family enzyme